MPERPSFVKDFLSAIQEKIPFKAMMTNTLADILTIDKDSVYRRIRGEVRFSFSEIAAIAKNLGISLDAIAGIETVTNKPAQIALTKHVALSDPYYKVFKKHLFFLKSIKDEPNTKLMGAEITLPGSIFYDFNVITRLYMFFWHETSFAKRESIPFEQIVIPEHIRALQKQCCTYARHIKSTHIIWDQMVFSRIVTNVKFFYKVRLIKEHDIALIKRDLLALLNYVEKLAIKGKFEDTGNEVFFYLSDLIFMQNSCCIECKDVTFSQFSVFSLNAITAWDQDVFNETNAWIRSLKRMSTLITGSGEKIRTEFFDAQRVIIDSL